MCMEYLFWQNDYFSIFIETGPLSCSDNYVALHQSLVCVAHDTNDLCFASKYNALFIYVCMPTVARV